MILIGLSCALFAVGLYGVLSRSDLIAVLASIEVMLGGALVLLVGVGTSVQQVGPATDALSIEAVALIIIVVIAAEAAIGLALLVAVARSMRTAKVEDLTEVKG